MRIYRDTLKQENSLFIGFCLIISLFIAMFVFLYPGDEAAVEQLTGLSEMGDWEAAFGITYGEGGEYRLWLALLVFSYIGIVYASIPALSGTAIARDIDNNTLDLLMANPVRRRQVLLEKMLAVLSIAFLAVLYLFVLILVFSSLIGQSINISLLSAASIQIFSLMILVSSISVFFAVYFRDYNRARRYVGFIIMGSFIISMIVLMSEELEFLKYFQIFYYYNGASTLLKSDLKEVEWSKSIYTLIFSILLFGISIIINEKRDLVPHFSHRILEDNKQERGIPIFFFYLKFIQTKYPSFVEQVQSDRVLFYFFALLMGMSGLITPGMYPGDEAWVGLSKTYGGNMLTGSILRDHGVALNFIGYIATEGFGEFFLYMGIAAIILGPKIVLRDVRTSTLDMIFSQATPFKSIVKQRMGAVALEMFTMFVINYICYVIGIYSFGIGEEYVGIIGVGILFTYIICLLMTYILTLVVVLLKHQRWATGVASLVYFGTLLIFMTSSTIESLKLLGKITPFYWIDRIRILYEKNIILSDMLIFLGYVLLIYLVNLISLKFIVNKEFVE